MGLKIKTHTEIINDMALWITSNCTRLTDFFVGSVIRTIIEAVALEAEALYFQMHKGFKYAIESAIYLSFDFAKQSATASTGTVTITFKSALLQEVTINAGYTFSTVPLYGDIVTFAVIADTVCAIGSTSAVIPVTCTQAGVIGNVPANSIRVATIAMPNVNLVYNEEAFSNGAEEETTDARKRRFSDFIQTLARGTTEALRYGCFKVTGVTGVRIEDGIGIVRAYVHDANGELPAELKSAVEASLLDYRSAGIEVKVLPVIKHPVSLTIHITLAAGFTSSVYSPLILDTVTSFLNDYAVADSLNRSDLIKCVLDIDSTAILNVVLSLTDDVVVGTNEIIRAGTITIAVE